MGEPGLTLRQVAVVRFVRDFWESNGYGPSIREIGAGVGLTSIGGVTYQINRLSQMGLIERNPLVARTIRPARVGPELSDGCSEAGRISSDGAADVTSAASAEMAPRIDTPGGSWPS